MACRGKVYIAKFSLIIDTHLIQEVKPLPNFGYQRWEN